MAIEVAEAVVGALKGELAATAVNAPMVPAEVLFIYYKLLPFCTLIRLCEIPAFLVKLIVLLGSISLSI